MAQFTRTKKLTDYAYSPTDPASEDDIRLQVDNSIQEVADILYSTASGKGASQVGINGTAYADVQALATAFDLSGVGSVPPAGSVGLTQQAATVKTGLLADLDTTDKTSLVNAINEVDAKLDSATAPLDLTLGVLSIPEATASVDGFMTMEYATKLNGLKYAVSTAYTNNTTGFTAVGGLSIPVTAGKKYLINIAISSQNSNASYTGEGSLYLSSGSGTIAGIVQSYHSNTVANNAISAIGANGLAGSTWSSVAGTSICNTISGVLFTCATSGNIAIGFRSTNVANTVTVTTGSVLYVQELN